MDETRNEEVWEAEDEQDESTDEQEEELEADEAEDEEEAFRPLVRRVSYPGALAVRTPIAPLKGMRQVVLRTPSGVARMKLPSPLPTAREVNRITGKVSRRLAAHASAIRDLGTAVEKSRRTLRRMGRENVHAANASLLALMVSQLKEAVIDIKSMPQE